jgi:hypothetical protein
MKSLSLSNLVEYIHASPSRRTAIIRNAVSPPLYVVDRYGITYKAVTRALSERSTSPLNRAEELVRRIRPRSTNHSQRISNTLESLTCAREILPFVIAEATHYAPPQLYQSSFLIGELLIKVGPQAISNSSETGLIGVNKFHCSKGFPLTGEIAADFSSALYWYATEAIAEEKSVDHKLCVAVDVFAKSFSKSPARTIKRRKKFLDACEEIVDRWDAVAGRLHRGRGFGSAA